MKDFWIDKQDEKEFNKRMIEQSLFGDNSFHVQNGKKGGRERAKRYKLKHKNE